MDSLKTFFYAIFHSFFYTLKPGKTLFIALMVLTIMAVFATFYALLWLWTILMSVLCLAVFWDLIRLYSIKSISVEREAPKKMSLGLWHDIILTLHYQTTQFAAKKISITVFDHYPVNCELQALPQTITLEATHWTRLKYAIKPLKRGNEHFAKVQCLVHSPWSFWLKNHFLGDDSKVMIYPNFAAISQYALLATENHLSQLGIRKIRRRGEGMDFNQLREYREGDSLRQIDWKATSRLRKLISREYQDEKDQEILFLLDCGRRMLSHDGELSHFDHSLNAMLLLSYVALHQGDAVGLCTFATEDSNTSNTSNSSNSSDKRSSQRWLPAKKGMATIHSLLNNVYDLHASTITPDYTQGVTQLLLRQKKRALIIVLTNLRDEDSHDLLNALQLLKHKHLVILASLKEQALEQVMERNIHDFSDAVLLASSCDYQNQRQTLFDKLYAHGINTLDVTPDKLAVRLVNRYLDIKSSGLL